MDIIVKTVLDYIQSKEEYRYSVLAGGAVRDHLYNLEARDYDIFVSADKKSAYKLIEDIKNHFGIKETIRKDKEYENTVGYINNVTNFIFEGKEFDIIAKSIKNDADFGKEVVKEFDFGMNMVLYNGLYIEDDIEEFERDYRRGIMTLYNLDSIEHLPNALKRYQNFCDKSKRHFRFQAPCLSLNNKTEIKQARNDFYTTTAAQEIVVDELVNMQGPAENMRGPIAGNRPMPWGEVIRRDRIPIQNPWQRLVDDVQAGAANAPQGDVGLE